MNFKEYLNEKNEYKQPIIQKSAKFFKKSVLKQLNIEKLNDLYNALNQ